MEKRRKKGIKESEEKSGKEESERNGGEVLTKIFPNILHLFLCKKYLTYPIHPNKPQPDHALPNPNTHPILEGVRHILALTETVDEVDQVEIRQLSVQALQPHIKMCHLGTVNLQVDASLWG